MLARPAGSPEEIEVTAGGWRQAATALGTTADELRREPERYAMVWQGLSAGAAASSLGSIATIANEVADALMAGANALTTWAGALRAAQGTVGVQQGLADDAYERYLRAVASASTASTASTASSGVMAVSLASTSGGTPQSSAQADLEAELASTRRVAAAACDLDAEAARCRRALEDGFRSGRLPPYRAHESLDDYTQSVITFWATKIPALSEEPDTVASVVWGIMTAGQAAFIGSVTVAKAAALWGHAANELPLWAVRYPFAPRMGLDRWGSPLLRAAVGEESQFGSLLIGSRPDRTRSLWAIQQDALDVYHSTAATDGWEAGARAGAVRSLTGGGIWRYGGAAGGVTATGMSVLNVASQGNPIDAYRANGAGYVADLAETGFNASFTAMMVCPNPVTVGATVVTGVAWAGLQAYDHWDDITGAVSHAPDLAGKAIDAGATAVAHSARKVGSWLNPFD
ncbi:hypothetical protein [Frankia sp. Cr1]|uniref:hypothetical protein n=1 Tax=Frankia sp. Cr1 TaxID=3073931 RepID=UPI002AD3356F|nr:hypothetical protein [Frankia sp. Cr1]